MQESNAIGAPRDGGPAGATRRAVLRSAAWAAPVVALAAAAPSAAASVTPSGTLTVTSSGYQPSQAWGAFAGIVASPHYEGGLTDDMIVFSHPVTITRWVVLDSGRVLQLFFMPDDRSLPGVRATFLVPGYAPLPWEFGYPA